MTGRIVLDTGVFFRIKALADARQRRDPIVIPAIAYAERLRQVSAQGPRQAADFRQAAAPFVEPFGLVEAERLMTGLATMPRADWRRLARDAFIASHVRPGDELWTTNPADFVAVGVALEQIVAV